MQALRGLRLCRNRGTNAAFGINVASVEAPAPTRHFAPLLAVLAAVAAALPLSLVTTAGGAGAAGNVGWLREDTSVLGVTPFGLRVVVDRSTPHHAANYRLSRSVALELNSFGLPVTFGAWGSTRQATGKLVITESAFGCNGGAQAITRTWLHTLTDGRHVIERGEISVCPSMFRLPSWKWSAVLRHEFGHAVGLGHYNAQFNGSWQIMLGTDARVRDYQAGDRAGLRWLAHNAAAIKARYQLKFSSSQSYQTGSIVITGSVVNPADTSMPVTVTLTDNGQTALAPVPVDPATHRYTLAWVWPGSGSHLLCVKAQTPGSLSTSSSCSTWS